MPGRDYTKAYARFEQALGGADYPSYPSTTHSAYRFTTFASSRPKSFAERARSPESLHLKPASPSVETHLLPPTPPPSSHPQDPSFGLSNRLATPELTPDTRQGTPFTTFEAPTPRTTPPSPDGHPTVKHPRGLSYHSSRAESFCTAQENVSPHSSGESPIELPLQGVRRFEDVPEANVEAYALGLRSFDRVTERAHRKLLQEMDLKQPSEEEVDTLGSFKSSRASGSMRKRRRIENAPKELTFLDDPGQLSLKSPADQDSPSSWLDGSSSGENSPSTSKDEGQGSPQYQRLSTPESKPLPPSSEGSPVVEASIVDSPPRKHRTLRHVSKNAELRSSPQQSKSAEILGHSDEPTVPPPAVQVLKESDSTVDDRSGDMAPKTQPRDDPSTAQRTRSLLVPRVPSSLRSRWRRSAPGLTLRESSSGLSRNLMEAVPEDKPLPESPQPPTTLDMSAGAVPSLRRGSEHSMVLSEKSGTRSGIERIGDGPSARNTHARSSPVSDASEAFVRDATAVNIYPHNNNSLVVVENPGSSNNASNETHTILSRITSADEDESTQTDHLTPVKKRNSRNVESPLTNPRRPPEPPAVSMPPSATQVNAKELTPPALSESARPLGARQASLSKRAKRYSDTFASSLSRIASGNRTKAASVIVSSQALDPELELEPEVVKDTLRPALPSYGVADEIRFKTPFRSGVDAKHEPDHEHSSRTPRTTDIVESTRFTRTSSTRERFGTIGRMLSARHTKSTHEPQTLVGDDERLPRGLTHSLGQKLRERSVRREEQRHLERQQKLRHSIGARFYVEHGMNSS
ncbi:MAG: hypothetical protein Q9159_003076 [Coniocarpon cinnabarinum]